MNPAVIQVRFVLEDPAGLGIDDPIVDVKASKTQTVLEVALEHGINIEHACGGVCACSTCHVYIESGGKCVSEPTEAEDDRVEEAPGLQKNSRLSCQAEIVSEGAITVRVPAWNRNAVKEVPH